MSKVVFVGGRVLSLAFRPLGVEVLEAEDARSAAERVSRAVEAGCSVLLITEECALWAADLLSGLRAEVLPAVAVLPGATSTGGMAFERLKRNVEKALGSSLILRADTVGVEDTA
jgi:V/A-type H+-transporting ATPase subunit F